METEYNYLFKYILIGESGVGKTSLMTRFTDQKFESSYSCTIGVDFKIKSLEVLQKKVKLQIWDTAGQERFRTITRGYYRGARCIIIVFDLTDRESFENLSFWFEEIKDFVNESVEVIILGNKADLTNEIKVSNEEITQLINDSQLNYEVEYFEVSAKENLKVDECFHKTAENLIRKNPQMENNEEIEEEDHEIDFGTKKKWFCF